MRIPWRSRRGGHCGHDGVCCKCGQVLSWKVARRHFGDRVESLLPGEIVFMLHQRDPSYPPGDPHRYPDPPKEPIEVRVPCRPGFRTRA